MGGDWKVGYSTHVGFCSISVLIYGFRPSKTLNVKSRRLKLQETTNTEPLPSIKPEEALQIPDCMVISSVTQQDSYKSSLTSKI